MMLLIGMSTILTIYIGGKEAIAGKIEIGNIAEFVIYVNMLTWPVAAIGWVTSLTQRAAASQRRINEFLQVEPEFSSKGIKIDALRGEIDFENVSYTYAHSGIKALNNVSFHVKAGGSIGVIGKTGSGKTSLVDLLSRNLNPVDGTIKIDGNDILKLDIQSYRSHMGVVPQEGFLFSDTIKNNIGFGSNKQDVDFAEIENAAKDAEIYDNIMEFPEKFETMVGERGITLSGGQKQRISIARSLIRKPSILVFDDCLSAVDTLTERAILENFKKHMKNKTTVLISHRVSTVENADEIIVLSEGTVSERGNHEALLNLKGLYYEMFVQQKMEEEELLQ
jgi:ATP-binding cassette subfamily B protein